MFQGGVYTVPMEQSRDRPRYWYSPGSFNSQKGHLFLRTSSLEHSEIDFRQIEFPEYNQSLEYARLCPNMSVPVLEIANKIITDSREIQAYLCEHHPSRGDAAVEADGKQKKTMEDFLGTCLLWDEYLFSYRQLPGFLGTNMHRIRLICLSQALHEAALPNSGINIGEDLLLDGRTIREAYVRKIAQVRSMLQIGCEAETRELTAKISANERCLEAVFCRATELLADQSTLAATDDGPSTDSKGSLLLMGGDPTHITAADVYLAVAVIRIRNLDEPYLEAKFREYPLVRYWWEHFLGLPEAQVLLEDNNMKKVKKHMLKSGKIFKMMGCAMGICKPRPLPDDIEKDVRNELTKMNKAYFTVSTAS